MQLGITDIDTFDFKLRKPEDVVKSAMAKLAKNGKGILRLAARQSRATGSGEGSLPARQCYFDSLSAYFVARDHRGQALAYVYFEEKARPATWSHGPR